MKILLSFITALVVLAGCGGDGDRTSHPSAAGPIQINCKSPISGDTVTLTQWRKDAQLWKRLQLQKVQLAQSIGSPTITTVSVECGDEIVFAPEPVVVTQPAPVVVPSS